MTDIASVIRASIAAKQALLDDTAALAQLERGIAACTATIRARRTIHFAGNGGSFADAQHLAAEFTSRFLRDRAPLPATVLGANASSMSAIGNDYGFDQVFARELRALGRPGDVFIPISTSGNSPNILEATRVAQEAGMFTLGLTGRSGGRLATLCDTIRVPSDETARIQECHILIGHILVGGVEAACFGPAT